MSQLPQIDSLKAPDRAVAQATRARRFPWLNLPFVVVVALIVCYGLVVVMSAVANDPDYSFSRQLAGVAAGMIAALSGCDAMEPPPDVARHRKMRTRR